MIFSVYTVCSGTIVCLRVADEEFGLCARKLGWIELQVNLKLYAFAYLSVRCTFSNPLSVQCHDYLLRNRPEIISVF